jgi:GGDEF domain-containing protein
VFAQPYCWDDGVLLDNVSGSLGIALYPNYGLDPEMLRRHADQAMSQGKRRGGNCVSSFNSD